MADGAGRKTRELVDGAGLEDTYRVSLGKQQRGSRRSHLRPYKPKSNLATSSKPTQCAWAVHLTSNGDIPL